MRRHNRHNYESDEDVEVAMSPLIDCVFLLLIFFLVTTMIKRKEKLLPIHLPDQTSSVAAKSIDKTLILGLDKNGKIYSVRKYGGSDGELVYEPIENLVLHLKKLVDKGGIKTLKAPLRIDCDRNTPFQKAIETLDICKLQGFYNVGLRTRGRKE
jgi:biopolymer transport protein ExbD